MVALSEIVMSCEVRLCQTLPGWSSWCARGACAGVLRQEQHLWPAQFTACP
jgi:hypothetical protein